MKGDDNDTCNALINGQAAYGIYALEKALGTNDLNKIRQRLPRRQLVIHTRWYANRAFLPRVQPTLTRTCKYYVQK